MNTQNHNEIFTKLKNKNIQEDKILGLLLEATKYESINKIEKYGCNLLFFSCLYDNNNAFKVLSEKFSEEFKNDFKKCALLTYTNKNPHILKLSLQHINIQSNTEKEELLKNFANNCFRSENIDITQSWLQNNLDNSQLDLFISELFRNNNKPYLSQISKLEFWKEQIKKINITGSADKLFFYKKLISEPTVANTVVADCETHMETEVTNIKKTKDLVVLKKKKKTTNLIAA
jgi:hypothetical protein